MKREEREAILHDRFFSENTRGALEAVYGADRASRSHYMSLLGAKVAGKDVLEYGCGTGATCVELAKLGARVSGIDISPEAIRQGQQRAADAGVTVDLRVMDAQALEFPDASFDVVFGRAILHHLDLTRSMEQIARVLRPGGTAVFLEPLGHNPALELFRRLTPGIRTPDEKPLLVKDLNLCGSFFEQKEIRYFHLVSLGALPLARVRALKPLYRALERLDDVLFRRVPFLRKHAWTAVMSLSGPLPARRSPAAKRSATILVPPEQRASNS